MLGIIIKLISISFCGLYTLIKISQNKILSPISRINTLFILVFLSIASIALNIFFKELTYFIPMISFWIIISYISHQPQQSFIMVTISYTLSIASYGVTSFLSVLVLHILFHTLHTFPYTQLAIIASTLQFVIIYFICKNKRLKRGMPFLSQKTLLNFATILCLFLSANLIYFFDN